MKIEEIIEKFCSRPHYKREHLGNTKSVTSTTCSHSSRCSRHDSSTQLIMVVCNNCEPFTPDKIGDGSDIDYCDFGIKQTQALARHTLLYRYAKKYCERFSKLMR